MDADLLAEQFSDRHGAQPEGVWAAPGRVNLIGEHTDYVGGYVLPLALPHRCMVAVSRRDDETLGCTSLTAGKRVEVPMADLTPGKVRGWAAYLAGVVWALRASGHQVGGAEILVDSDVPLGAGLSSSAALECSVGLALNEIHEFGLERTQLALLCQHAENLFVGMPSGVMDQMASLCSTEGHALFLDCRSLHAEAVPFALHEQGLELLVIDTRASHRLVDGAYADRRISVEEAAVALGVRSLRDVASDGLTAALDKLDPRLRPRTRHVVTENSRVLLAVDLMRSGEFAAVGQLMSMSHRSLRDDYEVSCPELDTAVDAALTAGALGARMTGGGFGGCAIALVYQVNRLAIEHAVTQTFQHKGFRDPRFFTVTASPGAQRVR